MVTKPVILYTLGLWTVLGFFCVKNPCPFIVPFKPPIGHFTPKFSSSAKMSCTVFPLAVFQPAKMNHLVDSSSDSVVVSTSSLFSSPSSSGYGIVSSSPINPLSSRSVESVRRSLFGPTDSQANRRFAQQELNKIAQVDEQRWNFDFTNDVPLSGRFQWESAASEGGKVPECYKSLGNKSDVKIRPDIMKRISTLKTSHRKPLKISDAAKAARRSLTFDDPKDSSPASSPKSSPTSSREASPPAAEKKEDRLAQPSEIKVSINIQDKHEPLLVKVTPEEKSNDWSDAEEDETETISVSAGNTSIDKYVRSSKKRALDMEEKLEARKKAKREDEPLKQQQSA